MITIEGLSIRAGAFTLSDISCQIPTGGYGILMGRTGCGKTATVAGPC